MRTKLYLIVCLLCFSHWVSAQSVTLSGKVVDSETSDILPGVNILVKGTDRGTTTDLNGEFKLQVSPEDVLVLSFIGYLNKEIQVGNRTSIEVALEYDIETLQEVVVVGYGTQKKKVVTGAISSVSSEDLETLPINNIGQALQGRTSGLTIASNSGQPGEGATIRVRGITTLNNNDPLWIVDGVVVDNGGIGYLNQNDIESIEVLKDAASQAIYGARAAAGVILVTTKSGKSGKITVNYNGYYGSSAPARKLDLLNATEYATLRNESSIAAGNGVIFPDPSSLGAGTDWQDVIFNDNAIRQNHEVSISGGNEVSTFYTSFGYLSQEGIVASDISNYERYNVRLNSTHKINDWITFGQNLGYSREKSVGLGNTNSEYGGPLSSAINLDPITPIYETDPEVLNRAPFTVDSLGAVVAPNGQYYAISPYVQQEMSNPLAYIQTRLGNYGWSNNIVGNAFLEAEPIKGLKIRSTIGIKQSYWGGESYTPVFFLNAATKNNRTSFNRNTNRKTDWNLENTISYTKKIGEHDFSILVGQGAYKDDAAVGVSVTAFGIPADNFDEASLGWSYTAKDTDPGGYENVPHKVSSLFTRLNYNFKEKYLLTAVMRRDGSSNFGSNFRYGYFPSASIGWVASDEDFWPSNKVVNFLKIRGGYGVVGNDQIGKLNFVSTIGGGRNYSFGSSSDSYGLGYSPNSLPNPNLKWEETSQTNIGFEATMLQRLKVNFDWYKKVTNGILQSPDIPGYVGAVNNPAQNIGDMENTGFELELGYNQEIGDFTFSVNGNVSYLQNKVTFLGDGREFLDGGQNFQASTQPITRTAVGQPINSFYGYKILGVFQTQEDVNNHVNSEGKVIQPDAVPGDFIWEDLDDNGEINVDDRDFIGSPVPDWSYGLTVSATYKNFDLTIFGQGVAGNQIFQGLRRLDITGSNYQRAALGRWTGPGTSNDYARLDDVDPNGNFRRPSEFYLEDGDYFRIKNIQLGYTLPESIISVAGINKLRVYVMAENLITFTKYTGFDPEIGGGVFSIDRGIYPQARSIMGGLSLTF
ncbi:SusC/RagA family TonB-linked outer membrane protein [Marivirga lumbricoides]|uniref:SusC/RagA family TonB-linked outer membrane protein n=1 Tax=Marivirga lumbricoides TaxID=1046115 RepID=A0A2T4DU86_9BACT|nr:SusC/RagA family TonB-linked outer membrane protein [Marivirga lumbricoides]GGC55610.1 SusC/RagA family TonB-linked outer membrane protein [Marivirga lumbricoides]